MSFNYAALKAENERRYGTDIGEIGPMLLANRYADRTHFIFELLQNAEDALARRAGWSGPRSVDFNLSHSILRVSHFGTPFTERDIRGICGIAKSTKTKDLSSIGRFGIGFKSVYAYTDRPEVHSNEEHFAIDNFVWPTAIPPTDGAIDKTTFFIPLRTHDSTAASEISLGLQRLGPRILLFLREIHEISWSVKDGPSGLYLRDTPEPFSSNARKITLIGEKTGAETSEEYWLVFSREVRTSAGEMAGYVEVAFSLKKSTQDGSQTIQPINDSALFAFFPTILPTNLGFIVQGPYRTTPSRDNVPREDDWNQCLVKETADLLIEALRTLREKRRLTVDALRSLPIDRERFAQKSMFAPVFDTVKHALGTEPLLPCFNGGYASAPKTRLGRTQELRNLFDPSQLSTLFQEKEEIFWISESITQNTNLGLRRYLLEELGIAEVTPESVLTKLSKSFLQAQSDSWILKLYEFLNGQPALIKQMHEVPLVRLSNGDQVTPKRSGQPLAFLPSSIATDFPTVRSSVCNTDESKKLLALLGLTEPDAVDDVVRNVLPKYNGAKSNMRGDEYAGDIGRILKAFATDLKSQREKLLAALRMTSFIMAVDAGSGLNLFSKPGEVYLATQRLKDLFQGVGGVFLVDDSQSCLRGEDVRDLLEACGATRYLHRIPIQHNFRDEQLTEMRTRSGTTRNTGYNDVSDFTIRGLNELLDHLPRLDAKVAADRATLLWEALCEMQDRHGVNIFSGLYKWFFYEPKSCAFDAAFVRRLNETSWVPDRNGELQPPHCIVFSETGWKENPVLLSKIRFKPPLIEALAREAGIDPGILDLLKKLGLTSEADLKSRLGIKDPVPSGGTLAPTAPIPNSTGATGTGGGQVGGQGVPPTHGSGTGGGAGIGGASGGIGTSVGTGNVGHQHTVGNTGAQPFISYLGAHPNDEPPDPDGLDHSRRMALEELAIVMILAREPMLNRTPINNPGFDLFEPGASGTPRRWIEVKAMSGDLRGRPVGISSEQFKCAQENRENFWLYIVEFAGTPERARIVRIQDPVTKTKTFTFDSGWLVVSDQT